MFPVQILSFTEEYTLKIQRIVLFQALLCVDIFDCGAKEENQENHGNKCNSSKFIEKHTTN